MPKPPSRRAASPNPDSHSANRVPRAVSALARSDPAGHCIAAHQHTRDQLLYAIRGVMTIRAGGSIWTIPSSHGLWVPARVEHALRMDADVEMRTLYFDPEAIAGMPDACCVLSITPLLRELILRAMSIRPDYARDGADGRIMQLIIDEVGRLEHQPLSLKLPADKRLTRLCAHILANLADTSSIAQLGARVGLSERSVIRLFPLETGMSPHRWRQQARLLRAFVLMEQGMSITRIALELGYGGPAAFTRMFGKLFGYPPRAVAARLRGG